MKNVKNQQIYGESPVSGLTNIAWNISEIISGHKGIYHIKHKSEHKYLICKNNKIICSNDVVPALDKIWFIKP